MITLNPIPNKKEYVDLEGQDVLHHGLMVRVIVHATHGRAGSYERGFKFTTSKFTARIMVLPGTCKLRMQ